MAMTAAENWFAEQRRMKEGAAASLRWSRDDDRRSWPVLVTETIQHVVWLDAPTHEEAVEQARHDTWCKINDETRECSWINAEAPKDKWDWERVYDESDEGYRGLTCDAHIEATEAWFSEIRWAELDATIEDENRDSKPVEQRKACPTCRRWREDGHEDTGRHLREAEWVARRAEIDAQFAAKAVA